MSQEEKVIIISISAIVINILTILINIGTFDRISVGIQNWKIDRLNKKREDTKN